VCKDARLDLAVNAALISGFKTSGQRCVSAGRILVHESMIDRFGQELAAKVKRLRIGDPLDAHHFTGPVINKDAVEKIERYNALAREEGARVLLEGGRMTDADHAKGTYLSPFLYRIEHKPGA